MPIPPRQRARLWQLVNDGSHGCCKRRKTDMERGFLLMALVTAATLLAFFTSPMFSASVSPSCEGCKTLKIDRKLKEGAYNPNGSTIKRDKNEVQLEDYHLVDPAPSSKAAVGRGPIVHGTPLKPYFPTPPAPPKHGLSP